MRFIQRKKRWQLQLPKLQSRSGWDWAHHTGEGTVGSAQRHSGCRGVRRPGPNMTRSSWVAFLWSARPPLRQWGWNTVSQSNPVRAVLGRVREFAARHQQAMLFFSWQEYFLIYLSHWDAPKSWPQPGNCPTTTTTYMHACVKKLLPTPGHLHPALWLYLCDRATGLVGSALPEL